MKLRFLAVIAGFCYGNRRSPGSDWHLHHSGLFPHQQLNSRLRGFCVSRSEYDFTGLRWIWSRCYDDLYHSGIWRLVWIFGEIS